MTDLPDEALGLVASFLPRPSVALFAVALTAPSSSWPKYYKTQRQLPATCRSIVSSSSWETLNFEEIEGKVAKKLADDDVFAVLACIHAGSTVKKLNFSGCHNVVGSGFEPLRGSIVLEQLDLMSIGQHEDASEKSRLPFDEECFVPILTSIVEAEDNSLKQLELPLSMRIEESNYLYSNPILDSFLERYNQLLESRRLECSKCNNLCLDANRQEHQWIVTEKGNQMWGCQMFTCNKCMRNFCNSCRDIFGETHIDHCANCQKHYCTDCVFINGCESCSWYVCEECAPNAGSCEGCGLFKCCRETCNFCEKALCSSCVEYHRCDGEGCSKIHCGDCVEDIQDVRVCDSCGKKLCSDCRFLDCVNDWKGACADCLSSIGTMAGLKDDNEKLRKEIEDLKEELHVLW